MAVFWDNPDNGVNKLLWNVDQIYRATRCYISENSYLSTVKPGYNEHGYNEFMAIASKSQLNISFTLIYIQNLSYITSMLHGYHE
jgi:hypothetical protein